MMSAVTMTAAHAPCSTAVVGNERGGVKRREGEALVCSEPFHDGFAEALSRTEAVTEYTIHDAVDKPGPPVLARCAGIASSGQL